MPPLTNKELTIKAWEAFSSRDARRIAAAFTADAEWIAPHGNATAVALGVTNHMSSRDSIGHFIANELDKLFSGIKVEFLSMHSAGDTVIVEERMTASLVNGRPYDVTYCFIFEFKDGLIRQVREYMDTLRGWRMVFGPEPAN